MRKVIMVILAVLLLSGHVYAQEETEIPYTMPEEGLSDEAKELMPEIDPAMETDFWSSFGAVAKGALKKSFGSIADGLKLCAILLCILTLCSVVDLSGNQRKTTILNTAGAVGITAAIMGSFGTMISMATQTVDDLSSYGSILLPALATISAMSGGINSAGSLYALTLVFSQLLLRLIVKLLIPVVYIYLALATAESALDNDMLSEFKDFAGWLITKSLRLFLYLFLAFMTITGVIGSTADAAAVKAAKAAVSGMIPVVGSILSDASDSLLSGAAILRNSVGIFGMVAILACCLVPVFKIGLQYLMLKLTTAAGGTVGLPRQVKLVKEFSTAMGYLLAMCASEALFLLIGTVCLMRVN